MERKQQSREYNGFREHYKQLVPTVCRSSTRTTDRVTAGAGLGRAQSTKRKYDEPFTKKEMERAVRTCRHTKLTLLTLKVSSSKLAGRR
jgi:hypothetical protein